MTLRAKRAGLEHLSPRAEWRCRDEIERLLLKFVVGLPDIFDDGWGNYALAHFPEEDSDSESDSSDDDDDDSSLTDSSDDDDDAPARPYTGRVDVREQSGRTLFHRLQARIYTYA